MLTVKPARSRCAGDHETGIGEQGRSGVAHHGDAAARSEEVEDLGRARALVVLVERSHRLLEPEVLEQEPGAARVLAGDHVDAGEELGGARRQIAEVADRRGDDPQRPARRVLASVAVAHGAP